MVCWGFVAWLGGGYPHISKSKWEGLHPGKIYIKYQIFTNYFFLLIQIKFIVIDYTPPDTYSISRFIFISGDLVSYLVPLLCFPWLSRSRFALEVTHWDNISIPWSGLPKWCSPNLTYSKFPLVGSLWSLPTSCGSGGEERGGGVFCITIYISISIQIILINKKKSNLNVCKEC
jgi:hypothetical protein